MTRSRQIGAFASAVGCLLVLSLRATALPVQAKTQAHKKPDWEDKIVPGSQLTVLDLARQIIPDIKNDSAKIDTVTGSKLSGIRLLDGVEETGMELDPDSSDKHEITEPDSFWSKDGSDRLLVLLFKVDAEGLVIGLFKISPDVTLLDAATMAQDIHTSVDAGKLWEIRPGQQAIVVECWHDNSSESYDNYTFISIVDRKLRAIAGPIISSGAATYLAARQRLCKTSMTPTFQFVRAPGNGYFDLIVDEASTKVCHPDSEEWSWKTGIVYQKSVRKLWRWSAKNKQYRRASSGRR